MENLRRTGKMLREMMKSRSKNCLGGALLTWTAVRFAEATGVDGESRVGHREEGEG